MKLFLDTANVKEIREGVALGVIDGVTTNPSLIAKENRNAKDLVREIAGLLAEKNGPVSAEVVSTHYEEMVDEGRKLAKIASNIVVKCPLTRDGIRATRILSTDGIRVNVTLVFSAVQALLAAKAGAAFVSPFVGRLDDRGQDGMALVGEIKAIFSRHQFPTQLLAASIRHPIHVHQAALLGADVATMPWSVFEKLFLHPLTEQGLKTFLDDWHKLPPELR